jgi:glycerophosphoryl diester phosphodiesterase
MKIRLLFLLVAFSTTVFSQNTFDIEGHRGCRGLYPENTIVAFINAVKLGVNTLEMDMQISKDGQIVISHDYFMGSNICTAPNGKPVEAADEQKYKIYNLSYDEIKKFDCGSRGNAKFPEQQKVAVHKPLLSEVIDTVEKYIKEHHLPPVRYNIETKSTDKTDDINHPKPAVFAKMVYDLIKQKGVIDKCILQSFDPRTLQEMRKIDPNVTTALLIDIKNLKGLKGNLKELGFNPTIYSPYYMLVNKKLVRECHEMHIQVLPWTVNDEKKMVTLKKMGVDGLISDYPDREIKVLR